uniref:Succinyl-CoA:3-ketoacid-coenzyme A transferase n=1 Tax=Blastobotrys adeninivorans TaxID=409370 RepID=A0A060T3E9_BLAAD
MGVLINRITIQSVRGGGRRAFSTSQSYFQINKVASSAKEALDRSGLKSGQTVLCGGFGLSGNPFTLINEILARKDTVSGLTVASNNAGVDGRGLGLLLESRQIKKMICSYIGENKTLEKQYLTGELEIELNPQGTLAERMRAAGAGVPAFYTPAGVGTAVETGELPLRYNSDGTVAQYTAKKETRTFKGKKYVMEEALEGDVAIVKCHRADSLGNVSFRGTANNFNGTMARAAKYTIVEADEIVANGEIAAEEVHVPGVYVNSVIKSTVPKEIERLTLAKTQEEIQELVNGSGARARIIKRAAQEFKNGMYANLGIGMPTLAPSFVDKNLSVQLQSENGVLGVGPYPQKGEEDADYINAGKETITLGVGASVFGSEESFAMIRAGNINMSMLGAMQVSQYGDLANWMLPGRVKGMGGAMDLVANTDKTKIVATLEHCDRKGNPKIIETCTFPLTGAKCVSRIITDLAVFDVDHDKGLTLIETAKGVTVDEIRSKTGASFEVSPDLKEMDV